MTSIGLPGRFVEPRKGPTNEPRMTDYVATRSGDRLRVKLSTGWTITYEDGATHAQICAPGCRRATGAIHAPKPATVERLAAALVEGIRDRDPRDPGPFRDREHLEERTPPAIEPLPRQRVGIRMHLDTPGPYDPEPDAPELDPWVDYDPGPVLTNETISDGIFWNEFESRCERGSRTDYQ
jgi:hypothetical protein